MKKSTFDIYYDCLCLYDDGCSKADKQFKEPRKAKPSLK